jgi:type II secretory pathway component GspD/PulD (secretin)
MVLQQLQLMKETVIIKHLIISVTATSVYKSG